MSEDRLAERRLWLLTLVRLAGIGLVVAGLGVIGQSGGALPPLLLGLLMMAKGAGLTLMLPRWLAGRWKS